MLTVQETANALGLSTKAVQRRIERGSIQSVRNDGRRWIPSGEVERVRQLESPEPTGVFGAGQAGGSGDMSLLLERLETLAAENGRFKALQEVNESDRERLQGELFKTRAQVQELEAKLAEQSAAAAAVVAAPAPRRRWFSRA